MTMRNTLWMAAAIALLGAGCQTKPAPNLALLDNASTQTWNITAGFANGQRQTHEQEPESFFDYGETQTGTPSRLTRIEAVSTADPPVTYSLSGHDLARLREVAPGNLMLVLYDEGIACLSPDVKKVVEQQMFNNPFDRAEYFRLLGVEREEALNWTRKVLGH